MKGGREFVLYPFQHNMLRSWWADGSGRNARRPVSRVLSPLARGMTIHLGRPSPSASRDRPGWRRGNPPDPLPSRLGSDLPPLLGLAPGGVYPATAVTGGAVRSYRTLSPLPPWIPRWDPGLGGLLSVALSLRSPSPGVTRHRISVEPGLSSPRQRRQPLAKSGHPAVWHDLIRC